MNNNSFLEILKSSLEQQLVHIENSEEWIYINLINFNTIDITIVSNKDLSSSYAKEITVNVLKEICEKYDKELQLRFFDFYSVEEAEFIGKDKPRNPINTPVSFGNALNIKPKKINQENADKNPRIISFYSYKGGVGRTVSLIQTAYFLAKKGKKVLILDLDIEAPSFQDIFEDYINKETKGLVDYLYSKLYSMENETEVPFNSIISKVPLNVKGDIYFVPSTSKLDLEYLRKLELLKQDKIINDEYITDLIKSIKKQYDIDYFFIDSRTGLNKWGAISLFEIATESILLAYPNRENIEGLKLIISLIDKAKKFTVVFSRIDTNKEATKISEEFFKELNLEQDPIYIGYDSLIANSQKYPMEDTLSFYENISSFLLEQDINESINKYITEHTEQVKDLLITIRNIDINNLKTNNDHKIMNSNNYYIIQPLDFEEDLKDTITQHSLPDIMDIFVIEKNYKDLNITIDKDCLYTDLSFKAHLFSYIAKCINDFREFNSLNNSLYEFKSLENKSIKEYKKYLFYESLKGNEKIHFDTLNHFLSCCNNFNNSFDEIFLIIDFSDIDNLDEYDKYGESRWLSMKTLMILLEVVSYVNTRSSIKVKLVFNSSFYNNNEIAFNNYSSNTLQLDWSSLNKNSAVKEIEQILVDTTQLCDQHAINKMRNYITGDSDTVFLEDILLDDNFHTRLYTFGKDISNIIYGKRVNPSKYSQLVSHWIYDELIDRNILSKKNLANLIHTAIDIELSSNNLHRQSIIYINSFEKAIDIIYNNTHIK